MTYLNILKGLYFELPWDIYFIWVFISAIYFYRIKIFYKMKIRKDMTILLKMYYFIFTFLFGPFAWVVTEFYFRLSADDIYNYKKIVDFEKYKKFVKRTIKTLDEIKDVSIDNWSEEDKRNYEINKKKLEEKIQAKEKQFKKDYNINI